ncbi:D,D-heptose 1,7-bisphosphate phosphatase [Virgibacillus pantothenticus]|uniref:D,D-heptose 1,7-bisphosphate phosphatase n=1 Tax=Virgibacillus pantothenticus TaxID=1473 RepID=A0A0L0QS43_VIRPA|nr:HAD family hydrolase [Virgibacillus pantothenticus]KNE21404.1 histidinol phosphatase [Virgibacillus pantothenticus]MBU8566355.1 HAD family hydrolase [Virgibacillus pantothenticus]MBU8600229.1 HAD family hydrolase [Virgibacillus pantothenticus]MBU8633839.1 HAD family hydrolase [Virgibacillus pantothenticus]MBU8641831.1 HAD family hydrolase [Virgibacillus pantothenticus]
MQSSGVFLDRDGVINEVLSERVKFVNQPEDFYLLPGVGEAIKQFNKLGYFVFVVTNQGGVGLGYMTEGELAKVHQKMAEELALYGAVVDAVAYCPHKPHAGCACRKPNAAMITRLAKKYNIDLTTSYMVGDRHEDMEAGKNAGTATILVGEREKNLRYADMVFPDLSYVATYLTGVQAMKKQ